MNNFNTVFLVIKKFSKSEKKLAELDCFEIIAKEANIPLGSLALYLNHLQDMGLIKFSLSDRYVYLTTFGNKHEQLTKG